MGKSNVSVDISGVEDLINNLFDDTTMYRIHQALAKRCDPYVPYRTGALAQSGLDNVSAQGVTYTAPYAEKVYYGVGVSFNPEYHPKATALWDKVMMQEQGEEFCKECQEIVERRARELNGE